MMTKQEIIKYDILVEFEICTVAELNLARNLVSGSWTNVIDAVIYARTGYRDFDQWYEATMEEE